MANDQGITKHDIGPAERAVYKVYLKWFVKICRLKN